MSTSSSSTTSKTDWPRLKAMHDTDITLSAEHPAAEVDHIVRGIARQGLRPVPPKTLISLRVDADVLAWFKAQGAGYQTRMNAVLLAFKEAAQEASVPDTDTLAFVDEAGAQGFSRKLTSARDHEVALVCALLFPAERIEEFRSSFRPGYDRFISAMPDGGKLHITDAFTPGNEAWAAVAQSVRSEFYHLIRRSEIRVVYEARRLKVERQSFEHMESIASQARAMSHTRVRIPEDPSQSRVEEELIIGLVLKLDAFCDAAQRHRVDLFFDEIDKGLAKLYRKAMDRTGNISKTTHVVKGWEPETKSQVQGEISFQAHASFPLDTQHLGDLHVVGKSDPLILAADIVTNSLNDHLRRLPSDAFLNRPSSIAGWELESRVYGVRDNAIEDII